MRKRAVVFLGLLILAAVDIRLLFFMKATKASVETSEAVQLEVPASPLQTGRLAASEYYALQCELDANGVLTCWDAGDEMESWVLHGADAAQIPLSKSPTVLSDGVVDAAVGRSHLVFLKADGTVWTFGENFDGQLGNGTVGAWDWVNRPSLEPLDASNNYALEPVQAPLPPCAAVAAGNSVCAALTVSGEVYTWGDNSCGQIGNGERGNGFPTMSDLSVPEPCLVLTGVVEISFDEETESFMAVTSDGALCAWGGDGPNMPEAQNGGQV